MALADGYGEGRRCMVVDVSVYATILKASKLSGDVGASSEHT